MNSDEYTVQEHFLDVGDGHQLYVQDWGSKTAKRPIIFLHGGPGSSVQDKHKQLFDPQYQRVIFFDQRGCGKSLPLGSFENNTTDKLVDDIEKLAKHLRLDKFILTGGSWGSCLALAYGLKYPHRVHAMVLRGLFTASHDEINWVDKGRFKNFFPEVWDLYLAETPKSHHHDPSSYHFARVLGHDAEAAKKSAYAYQNVEAAIIQLDDRYTPENFDEYDPSGMKIEIHYLANKCFLPDGHILANAHKLTMPIYLFQGRYDMVCPPATAYKLHQKLPNSWLTWTVSGHKDERESWTAVRNTLLQLTSAA